MACLLYCIPCGIEEKERMCSIAFGDHVTVLRPDDDAITAARCGFAFCAGCRHRRRADMVDRRASMTACSAHPSTRLINVLLVASISAVFNAVTSRGNARLTRLYGGTAAPAPDQAGTRRLATSSRRLWLTCPEAIDTHSTRSASMTTLGGIAGCHYFEASAYAAVERSCCCAALTVAHRVMKAGSFERLRRRLVRHGIRLLPVPAA